MIAPLFEEAPLLVDEKLGVRVWFFDQGPTVVDQVTSATLTMELATFLSETAERVVLERYVNRGRQVTYVHDWSHFESYDAGARKKIIDWGRAARAHTRKTVVFFSNDASPFIRIAVATGLTMLKAVGISIEEVHSEPELLAAVPRG